MDAARGWRVPEPPSLAEIARHIPSIAPVASAVPRPRWSVMIPTFNCAEYLRRTLGGVLAQDPGPDLMQIEVIDDGSTRDDPAAVVAEVGRGRVAFHRNPTNLGATATFNVCVERARGHWVHLLHGDDLVLPGFYAACDAAVERDPALVMVAGRVITIDEHDRWLAMIGPDLVHAGTRWDTCARELAVEQRLQFAGVAVRRDAYERAGGFATWYGHVADWDMWMRVALLGPVWCLSRPFGCFRIHSASDTNRHHTSGGDVAEAWAVINVNRARLGGDSSAVDLGAVRLKLARRATSRARKFRHRGMIEGWRNQATWAVRLNPSLRTLRYWLLARLAAARTT